MLDKIKMFLSKVKDFDKATLDFVAALWGILKAIIEIILLIAFGAFVIWMVIADAPLLLFIIILPIFFKVTRLK